MAQIIEFKKPKKIEKPGKHRVESLVMGEITIFICENCGESIEVVNNKYPTHCPGCNLAITNWNDE